MSFTQRRIEERSFSDAEIEFLAEDEEVTV